MSAPVPNSSTGGVLAPAAPYPPYDNDLEDALHDVIAAVTGVADALVRPRFQPEPPDQPAQDADWVAFGIVDTNTDWDSYEVHDPHVYGNDGANRVEQDEEFVVLLSFYGPNASWTRSRFEAGIKLAQNRTGLNALQTKFIGFGRANRIPSLLKEKWYNRIDQRLTLRRRIVLTYPILTLQSASVHNLDNEQYKTDIEVNPPTP